MQSLKQVLTAAGTGIALIIVSAVLATGQLPDPGMEIDPENTALVITDPQNDFLSPEGVTWGVVGKSVTANKTVENIETLKPCSSPGHQKQGPPGLHLAALLLPHR